MITPPIKNEANPAPIISSDKILISIPPKDSCIAIKGIAKPKVIITIKILINSLLK